MQALDRDRRAIGQAFTCIDDTKPALAESPRHLAVADDVPNPDGIFDLLFHDARR